VTVLLVGEVGGEAIELLAAEAEATITVAEAEAVWRSLGAG
jgi:hypothetical protein